MWSTGLVVNSSANAPADGLFDEVGTLHLDRGYDSSAVRDRLGGYGIDQ